MGRFGGMTPATAPGIRRQLGRSQDDLNRLLGDALALRFVRPRRDEWHLTAAGQALGIEMSSAIEEIGTLERRTYRPYDRYLPGDGDART
jgi:hypothetical protein